ncbi:MAG TPA: magnesium transporter [Hyphomicrobiaceae bacterium]|nr:magnesium transporter [Hyphomicrobiaceae bacterium]
MGTAEETHTAGEAAVGEELVHAVCEALEAAQADRVRALTAGLRAPDLADLLELLEPAARVALIQALGPSFDYEALSEVDPAVRDQLAEALPNELLAKAVTELETDDAAYLIESLEPADKADILARLPKDERAAIERNLEYPEETAGRLMQTEFVAVAPYWTVGQVIDFMRETDELPDRFSEIFVVDPAFRVVGSVELSRLLRTKRHVRVEDIMARDRHVVAATADQEEVARQFERYDLMSAPVVDENQRLVGVVTVDDVVEVIQDEAEEDIKAMAGIGEESVSGTVTETAKSRIPWLVVNLATAIIASFVIKQFDATIEQMVALAVLMPIVASIGGNAGTQTMTVTVRALATQQIGHVNAPKVIMREATVGLLNGLVLSLIMAAVVLVWFGSGQLGLVIAAALIVNLLAAALAGILIPLTLHLLDLDPAPAAGVFVTMVTDVVGFLAFLGLATLWLL